MAVVVVALDRGFLDGAVHALDLAVGPRMVGLGQAMLDAVLGADLVEGMAAQPGGRSLAVLGRSANWMPLSVSTVWMR